VSVSPISEATTFHEVPITEMMDRTRAFVKVQEGCNESCSFCVIPQTRGRSRSRRPEKVLEQVRGLVDTGYTEIVITGVHVGDFGLDLEEGRRLLPDLVSNILGVPGLLRFRLSSIEPTTVTDELIELMRAEERFARHFHIPFQSGSGEILARMNRRYTAAEFADLLARIVEAVPDCGIGTDVICGFPGETDAHFQDTFDALVEMPITYIHPFTYSIRPGSTAEGFGDQVPGEVRKRRTRALKRLSREKSLAFRESHLGRIMPIYVEEARRDGQSILSGLTDNYLRVDLGAGSSDHPLVSARLTAVTEEGLRGEKVAAA
jgi:threonylcarbamoyladenosine tRNA methylthiotransferase MtaB